MEISEIIGLGYVIFASLSVQLPYVLFRHHPKMRGSELAEEYPKLAWLRYGYPLLSVVWVFGFGGILFFLMFVAMPFGPTEAYQFTFYILGAAIGSISILHGGVAMLTHVCPLPRKRGSLYVYDDEMQFNALMIMAMGVFVVIVAMAITFFSVL